MKKILVEITDNQKEKLDELKKNGFNQTAIIRTMIELLMELDGDATLIAIDKKKISVANGYGSVPIKGITEAHIHIDYDDDKFITNIVRAKSKYDYSC